MNGKDADMHEELFTPTPEQIAEACRAIQDGWTPLQEARRRNVRGSLIEIDGTKFCVTPYEFPVVAEWWFGQDPQA